LLPAFSGSLKLFFVYFPPPVCRNEVGKKKSCPRTRRIQLFAASLIVAAMPALPDNSTSLKTVLGRPGGSLNELPSL
jgi:hypothetical protein